MPKKKEIAWDYFTLFEDELGQNKYKCVFCSTPVSDQIRSLRNHFATNACASSTEEAKAAINRIKDNDIQRKMKETGKKRQLPADVENTTSNTVDESPKIFIGNPN